MALGLANLSISISASQSQHLNGVGRVIEDEEPILPDERFLRSSGQLSHC
jgi:hypothetical protein